MDKESFSTSDMSFYDVSWTFCIKRGTTGQVSPHARLFSPEDADDSALRVESRMNDFPLPQPLAAQDTVELAAAATALPSRTLCLSGTNEK